MGVRRTVWQWEVRVEGEGRQWVAPEERGAVWFGLGVREVAHPMGVRLALA